MKGFVPVVNSRFDVEVEVVVIVTVRVRRKFKIQFPKALKKNGSATLEV